MSHARVCSISLKWVSIEFVNFEHTPELYGAFEDKCFPFSPQKLGSSTCDKISLQHVASLLKISSFPTPNLDADVGTAENELAYVDEYWIFESKYWLKASLLMSTNIAKISTDATGIPNFAIFGQNEVSNA